MSFSAGSYFSRALLHSSYSFVWSRNRTVVTPTFSDAECNSFNNGSSYCGSTVVGLVLIDEMHVVRDISKSHKYL